MWQTAWQTAGGRNVSSSSASSCTHDFLSRCADGSQPSHHSDHTSPTPPAAAAPATGHPAATGPSSLTTHDFLQPLERGSGGGTYRADRDGRVPSGFGRGGTAFTAIAQALADRLVPGSSGTQAETVSPNSQHHRPLPNSSSRDDQSVVEHPLRVPDAAMDPDSTNFPSTHADSLAYWSSMRLKFAASDAAFSKGNGVSQPGPGPGPVPPFAKEWHAEPCLRPVKLLSEDDEDEEEECRDSSHKEAVFHKAESMQKQDAKNDLKGGTPRSKHSATEQRRRSKINDRFQMLRLLVPHSDQKRDKASFLLEVIEYIQILKDKVKKYESVEQGRKQDRLKSMVWDLCKRNVGSGDPALGGGIDPSRLDALVLGKDYGAPMSVVSLESMQQSAQSPFPRSVPLGGYPATTKAQPANEAPLLNNISASISNSYDRDRFSEASESLHHSTRARLNGHQGGGGGGGGGVSRDHFLHQQQQHQMEQRHCGQGMRPDSVHTQVGTEEGTAKAVGSKVDQRQCASTPTNGQHSPQANTVENEAAIARNSAQSNNGSCHDQSQQEDSRAPPHAGHDPVAIQGGVINVSSVYSQGLLDTLTKALHSSGLDLSQAKISVQIDLGKTTVSASTKVVTVQTPESSTQSHQSQEHTRQAASYPDSDLVHPHKRPKIETEG